MCCCGIYGYDGNMDVCTISQAYPAVSVFFFVSFVLIGTMIFLNLFIGVIMNGMDEARAEMAEADDEEKRLAGIKVDELSVDDLQKKLEEMQDMIVKIKHQKN